MSGIKIVFVEECTLKDKQNENREVDISSDINNDSHSKNPIKVDPEKLRTEVVNTANEMMVKYKNVIEKLKDR